MKNSDYLLNRVFLSALFLLLFNDFYLKSAAPSFLSGKLSDVSGLIVFLLFFTFLLGSKTKPAVFIATSLLFCWWKSALSNEFIHNWNNTFPFYSLERTVDYSDLFCLLVLIPLYVYQPDRISILQKNRFTTPLLLLTVFAIAATSKARPIDAYSNTKKYTIGETFKIKKVTQAEFLKYLSLSNLTLEKDPDALPPKKARDYRYYILRNFEIRDDLKVESMHIGLKERNGNLKLLIRDVTLFDPPEGTSKEIRNRLIEVFEAYFSNAK